MNIIDMHCDTIYQLYCRELEGASLSLRNAEGFHINLEKMKAGDYLLQNFAAFVDLEEAKQQFGTEDAPYRFACELVRVFREQLEANHDMIRPAASFSDLCHNQASGYLSAMLTLEEGGVCLGDLEKLRKFYQDGARMMTLTWNYENEIGYPAAMQKQGSAGYKPQEKRTYGLKPVGIAFLEEMEHLGMIIDVSHLSDDGFFDVWEHTKKPFVASHSNCRALCSHERNLSDEMLHMLGERGGIAGLNFYPDFLTNDRMHLDRSLYDFLADHALHMIQAGGSSCIGLGSDFDGFHDESQPADAAALQDLTWVFHKHHISDDQIDRILYQNVYELYREVL